jgi:DNA (cytosine-5)-methyltransferase 1
MIAVDLFAGAGGWSTGAVQAGARVAAAVNHWPVAVATHAANHPGTEHRCQDAALMDPRDLPAFDTLLASPACQGHSRARGTDRPHHDASRSTMWCVVNVADVCRPRMIAVENVPEARGWPLYGTWLAALRTLGYRVAEHVLNAADFGAPQERVRLIVTAHHERPAIHLRSPRLEHVAAETILDADGAWSPVVKPGRSEKTLRVIAESRRRIGPRFLLPFYGATEVGRATSRPLGTITTRDRYALVDGDRMRMLTVAEYLRGMTFPADYVLTGTRAERVMQVGNAVVPRKSREIVRQMQEAA